MKGLEKKKKGMAKKMVGTMDDIRKDGPIVRSNNSRVSRKLSYVVTTSGKGNETKLVAKK